MRTTGSAHVSFTHHGVLLHDIRCWRKQPDCDCLIGQAHFSQVRGNRTKITKFRASISSFLCTFVLTGCATTGGKAIYTPAVGSQVKVIEQLNAAGGKRLIIQNGRVLERQDVHVISPYCQFSLNRSWEEMSEPVAIRSGMFIISKSYRQQDWSWAEGTQFAGDTDRSMSTVMELSSDHQPEVSSLVCTRWGSVYVGGWVTIKEMRATLNGLVQLDDPTE